MRIKFSKKRELEESEEEEINHAELSKKLTKTSREEEKVSLQSNLAGFFGITR